MIHTNSRKIDTVFLMYNSLAKAHTYTVNDLEISKENFTPPIMFIVWDVSISMPASLVNRLYVSLTKIFSIHVKITLLNSAFQKFVPAKSRISTGWALVVEQDPEIQVHVIAYGRSSLGHYPSLALNTR